MKFMPIKQFLNTSSWTSHDFFYIKTILITFDNSFSCLLKYFHKETLRKIVQLFSSTLLACGCEKTATWHSDSKKINIDTICRYHFETEKREMEHLIIGILFETIFWHIDVSNCSLLPKLFWPIVRKICSSDPEKSL